MKLTYIFREFKEKLNNILLFKLFCDIQNWPDLLSFSNSYTRNEISFSKRGSVVATGGLDGTVQEIGVVVNWHLHHDNDSAHSSHLIQNFLTKNQTPVIRQAPRDFLLFPKLKTPLKRKRYEATDCDCNNSLVKTIPKEAFSECFQKMTASLGQVCGVSRRLL
jgi:hypothetical protein